MDAAQQSPSLPESLPAFHSCSHRTSRPKPRPVHPRPDLPCTAARGFFVGCALRLRVNVCLTVDLVPRPWFHGRDLGFPISGGRPSLTDSNPSPVCDETIPPFSSIDRTGVALSLGVTLTIRFGAGLLFRPWSHPPPCTTLTSFCFGYEPTPPDWQSCQVVGYPGTAQTWDSKGNQRYERQLSRRYDSSRGWSSSTSNASNRSRTAGGIAVMKPTPFYSTMIRMQPGESPLPDCI
ncbi:hypothetical protein V8E52_002315 [Russula decolorans]